ncbi:MAG: hypothetical protein EZS28_028120 [Streblomastix strix]|uniref:Uncharacterized protein n=1 Tax=Streblomastix strix TaxID=222440 RepID=A0A5J4V1D5_9EUKA|nr:MAG: hypothetical protein EZS28_028120 [Streblomastix strix]
MDCWRLSNVMNRANVVGVMSSQQHKFIRYMRNSRNTCGKMYMLWSVSDVDKIYFIEGDADSAYCAVGVTTSDLLDEKKILGLAIEKEGTEMKALAHKNYYIKSNKRLKMGQIKYIIEIAETNSQEAVIQLMNMLEEQRRYKNNSIVSTFLAFPWDVP